MTMIINLMRIPCLLRSNLLQRLPQAKENVRYYGLFTFLQFPSRSRGLSDKLKSSGIKFHTSRLQKFADESVVGINTNVMNNVILWKFERPKYFTKMSIFGVVQFTILMTFSYISWSYIPIFRDDMAWKEYVKKAYLPVSLCLFSAIAAIATSWLIWFFTCRSLRYIILNKGGTTATLVTYHPTKGSNAMVVPLEDIMVKKDRNDVGVFIALRIKSTRFFYLIDKEGVFINPDLYDQTVALDRVPKQKKKKNTESLLD